MMAKAILKASRLGRCAMEMRHEVAQLGPGARLLVTDSYIRCKMMVFGRVNSVRAR